MKRRPFQSRWSRDANLLARVVTGVLPTPESLLERQRLTELSAIDCFARGAAEPEDFRVVCDILNVAETFASMGIGPEVMVTVITAQRELIAAKARHDKTGSLTLTAVGLRALRDLYEYHDLQRTAVDWQTYEKAITKTMNRIRSEHPDVKVLT